MIYIELLDVENLSHVKAFLMGKNQAYHNRSNLNIPYCERTESELKEKLKDDSFMTMVIDNQQIIGGGGARYHYNEKGAKTAELFWIWVSPAYQNKGIGKMIIEFIECKSKQDECNVLTLNVLGGVESALALYKKCGFKPYKIWAYIEGTSYYLQMVKYLGSDSLFGLKRGLVLFLTTVKFKMLYNDDSSPKKLHRIIFKD